MGEELFFFLALRARSRELPDVFEENDKKNKTTSVYRLRRLCAQCMISNNNYINDGVFVVIFFKTMCNKTIIRFCFCYILNNQGIGKCYQPRPSARLITVTSSLIIPDITKPHPIIVY